jgi:hypothetical protein
MVYVVVVVGLKEILRIGLNTITRLSIKSFKKSRRKNHGKITGNHRWYSCISNRLCTWKFNQWHNSCLSIYPLYVKGAEAPRTNNSLLQ